MGIVLAHRPVYAATLNPSFPEDFDRKVERARDLTGTPFPPCVHSVSARVEVRFGGIDRSRSSGHRHLCFPALRSRGRTPADYAEVWTTQSVEEYLRAQGRFRHLTAPDIAEIQAKVQADWERLLQREREDSKPSPLMIQ